MAIYYDLGIEFGPISGGDARYVHSRGQRSRDHAQIESDDVDDPLKLGTSLPMHLKKFAEDDSDDDPIIKSFLKYNQYVVYKYVKTHPAIRGLLLFVKMGYGKSIIAAAIVHLYKQLNPHRKVICVMPKGLVNNFIDNATKYLKAIKADESEIKSYRFVSINASNMFEQLSKSAEQKELEKNMNELMTTSHGFLENSLLIIDEAHNLFNSITNDSENAIKFYNAVMDTKNIKIFFLTGTPIINHPHELVPCFNMLRGWLPGRQSLFPKSRAKFVEAFIDTAHKSIKNKSRFQNRILGLSSYYSDYFIDAEAESELFPRIVGPIVEKIPMSSEQYTVYDAARDSEREEQSWRRADSGDQFSTKGEVSSSYRFKSRQACNFIMPEHALGPKIERKKREDIVDNLTEADLSPEGLKTLSPKLARLSANLDRHAGTPGIIYSEYKSRDLAIIARHLELIKGFHEFRSFAHESLDDISGLEGKLWDKYARMTSDASVERRADILRAFTDPRNIIDGHILALLLISEASAEGMNTIGVRHIHIFDPYWNYARILQVIYRGARYMSHVHLPEDQRTVTVYIYLSTYPEGFVAPKKLVVQLGDKKMIEPTTDELLYNKSYDTYIINNSFEKAIAEVSIDCFAHYKDLTPEQKKKIECYMCAPTRVPLYYPLLEKDLVMENPCKAPVVKKLTVQEITVPAVEDKFYYRIDGAVVEIFMLDKATDAYIKMPVSHPLYGALVKKALHSELD